MAKFRKQRNREFKVYAEGSTACVIRHTSFQKGERLADLGVYVRVYDEDTGEHRGYQVASSLPASGPGSSLEEPSSAGIRAHEIRKFAGLNGRSRTAGMPEHKRLEREKQVDVRTGKHLLAEDELEQIIAKIRVWKQVGAKKKDILRAWPKGAPLPPATDTTKQVAAAQQAVVGR
jgi:hypothetical protein